MEKKKNPKKPTDYKTLRIRVPVQLESEIEKIMNKVETVRARLNKERPPEKKLWMCNHVLIEAIKIGLKDLSKPK